MEIFNLKNVNFYILIALAIVNSGVLCFVSSKLFQIIQLFGYKTSGYNSWLKDTKIKFVGRLVMLSFLSLICVLVTNSLLNGFGGYYSYFGLIFYFYFCVIFIINMAKIPQKTPLKQTRRMNRLIVVVFVIMTILTFVLTAVLTEYFELLRYGIVVLTPLAMPVVVPFANIIMSPIENLIRSGYLKKAKSKLKTMPNLIKIGITGSYGKTTTKHFLNLMLSKKYSVCMTPHSFNTPMGLTKVVLKYLSKNHNVLIAEMGAKQVGDIKYLCDFIHPQHAIVTSVGSQHLATFGSLENIAKTKHELIDSINDGLVILNANNKTTLNFYNNCSKNKYLAGVNCDNALCNITNIALSSNGTTFTLNLDGHAVDCQTSVVGMQNLQDIALSCAMAYKLGVDIESIKETIFSLKPMSHRMEVIKNGNLTVIDNAYNSSVEGSSASLETLKLFNTGKKIIVTPGIVEMGSKEFEANKNFGAQIAQVCDIAIIVNEVNKDALIEGLKSKNYDESKIMFAETLSKAKDLLKTIASGGDTILFENDLPDNYT